MKLLIKKEGVWLYLILLLISTDSIAVLNYQNADTLLKIAKNIYGKRPDDAIVLTKKAYQLAKIKNDKIIEVKCLNTIAKFYWQERSYDSAKAYGHKALLTEEKYRLDSMEGDSWLILGIVDHSMGFYEQAIEKYEKSVKSYKIENKLINIAKAYLNIGICKKQLSQYYDAIKDYLLAVNMFEKLNDNVNLANTYNSIALCFVSLNSYQTAIEYNKKALIIRINLKDSSLISQSFGNIGVVFNENNQPDSAIYYLHKSLKLQKKETDPLLYVNTLQNLGTAYQIKKKLILAKQYIERSLKIGASYNMKHEVAWGNFHMAEILTEEKKYAPALAAVSITEGTAKTLKLPELLMEAYDCKYKIYLQKGDYKKALDYETQKETLKDSIFTIAKDKAINELEIKYQTNLKERDIATLNLQNKLQSKTVAQQKFSIVVLIIGAVLLSLLFGIAYNSYLQKNKANIRIQHLMQELHHRVKNNLQIMSSLLTIQIENLSDEATKAALRENEARMASMNLIHSQLYQNNSGTQINMESYLSKLLYHIKSSFGGDKEKNISLRLEVEPLMVEADKAVAIGLIVNELATNAFKYAFEGETGEIYLGLKQEGKNKILLSLGDNGKGISAVHKENSASFGLKLVNLLTKQLGAVMNRQSKNGVRYQFEISV